VSVVTIEVYRGAGDRPGDDVADPLIGSLPCALARGRAEMDAHAHQRTRVDATAVLLPGARPGLLARMLAPDGGWAGKLVSVQHRLTVGDGGAVTAATTLQIERLRS